MDHLGAAFNPVFGINTVPLCVDTRELDDTQPSNFHTFHSDGRHAYIIRDDDPGQPEPTGKYPDSDSSYFDPDPRGSLTIFVQHWLFFELLKAILGHLPDYHFSHFIE